VPDELYRAPRPIEPDAYARAWAELRRRRLVAVGFFPVLLILLGVTAAARKSRQPLGPAVLVVAA
jgi:hypothetical protein